MATTSEKARQLLAFLSNFAPLQQVYDDVKQRDPEDVNDSVYIPAPLSWSNDALAKRIEFINNRLQKFPQYLTQRKTFEDTESLKGNIENYIGMTQVPTGLI